MGDTANWEFAAVVAAVAIGLGGLLLFTLIGAIGAIRAFGAARPAAPTAPPPPAPDLAASQLGLAGVIAAQRALGVPAADPAMAQAAAQLLELTRRADVLLEQQARLVDAIRKLVEAGVLRAETSGDQYTQLLNALDRVERHLARITTPGSR